MKAQGAVAELLTNPHGDVDGFRLKDDTEVKFPPHLGAELEAIVKPGELVRIDGRKHITPKGDVHLHADRIEVVATGTTIERHPPMPGGPGGPRREPQQESSRPREFDDLQRTQDEILRELRDLRKLLENGAS
ncbi:OB-fold nucleic acid binding domain-containing protein [Planctomyces sp. SH-PL14]|uniref:OB-fold nucleic acid binding domain-containing protein n=1 Tax=Planctomyces sp. SH-PL14 TaxID=1632864 RepID=UPI0009461DA6|nr:OB-fold nucleic acid binding domain-containing protein [Planctomyces sp. SH-PL14]